MTWVQAILQSIAALMISPSVPTVDPGGAWRGASRWEAEGSILVFRAESETAVTQCKENPNAYLTTSTITQGGHEFYLDGKRIFATAERSMQEPAAMYSSAALPCHLVANGTTLSWHVFTATHSLAHISRFPKLEEGKGTGSFFEKTLTIITAGTMATLGFLSILIFYGKVSNEILVSYLVACLAFSVNFALWVPNSFLISLSPLLLQKIADSSLWIAAIACGRLFVSIGHCSLLAFRFLLPINSFGVLIILLSGNLDQIQLGSNLAFIGNFVFLGNAAKNAFFDTVIGTRKKRALEVGAIFLFVAGGIHDMLMFQGLIESRPILSFGVIGTMGLLALAVNELIVATYKERDYLRTNLEHEVEKKTKELSEALTTLRTAQADLIQSAKLAALGTLSAGIAHEINNSLNYVNGSLDPLTNILKKETIADTDRAKANKLLGLMKEGLDLTFAIIQNLKRQTSASASEFEPLIVREVVDGAVLLLKAKLSGIQVESDVPADAKVIAQRVGLSQILMNLLGNAIDAITESANVNEKKIKITFGSEDANKWIAIEDSGPGISAEIRERIFDPFFTTKAIGKGTGLGLHIVLAEMKKQGGRVDVQSELGKGAKFVLYFPAEKKEVLAA